MPPTKKSKILPCIITSREAMEAVVADIVRLKLKFKELEVQMAQEVAEVQKRFQSRLLEIGEQIEIKEAGTQVWCQKNRSVFGDKKSLDLLLAVVGFRTTPHRVEKAHSKETWSKIALRLQALEWGSEYITEPSPEVAKAKLLADRSKLSTEQLEQAGIKFEQDEDFYIEPKSDVLEASVKEAA